MSLFLKRFLILWGLGVIATGLVIPYAFSLQKNLIDTLTISPLTLALISIAQTAVLLALAIGIGMSLAHKVGLGTPRLDAFLEGKGFDTHGLFPAILWGSAAGVAIIVCDLGFTQLLPTLATMDHPSWWQGLFASFYGGIVEELLLRLFAVSFLVWGIDRLLRAAAINRRSVTVWLAIIVAAVLFGILHLPATSTFIAITPLVVIRAIVLNGIGGVIFGWLYWRRGLEAAILAHFTADILLHVLYPLI